MAVVRLAPSIFYDYPYTTEARVVTSRLVIVGDLREC